MDEEKTITNGIAEKKKEKGETTINYVMLVQVFVCIIAVVLVFILSRLSPATFDFIKQEYNRIMSADISTQEIADSAKTIIGKVEESQEKEEKSQTNKIVPKESKNQTDSNNETVAVMSLFESNEKIIVPVHGEISSEYGNRVNPVTGQYLMHSGVDIAASQGTKIRAAYSGIVSDVGSNSVGGNYISLVHKDGSETLYCHCSKIIAKKGDVIRAGETIALVGSTGRSTGPHLHFEIHIDDNTVNPLNYLTVKNGEV